MEEYETEYLEPGYIGLSESPDDEEIVNIVFIDEEGSCCFIPCDKAEAEAVDYHIMTGEVVEFPVDGKVNAYLLFFLIHGRHMHEGMLN